MAVCPKCGSEKFKYELRETGEQSYSLYFRTGGRSAWFLPSGQWATNREKNIKTVGFCPDCGYIKKDIPVQPKKKPGIRLPFKIMLWVIIALIALGYIATKISK